MDANIIEKVAQDMPLEIGFKLLSENATLPTKAHASDSGFDLYAAEDIVIAPGETVVIPTDIAVQLPQGYEATVRSRSGITSKTKLRVQLGTIDNAYIGNIGVICDNASALEFEYDNEWREVLPKEQGYYDYIDGTYEKTPFDSFIVGTYKIRKGDRIAQLVVQPIPAIIAVEITGELDDSDRGVNGFGSSGV